MARLELESAAVALNSALEREFPGEEFLEVELYAVFQALFGSLRWAALRNCKEISGSQGVTEDFAVLETTDHFSSKWLERQEIVDRIVHTSGLSQELSDAALRALESIIDNRLREFREPVDLEDIGRIEAHDLHAYRIEFAERLIVRRDDLSLFRAASEGVNR